MSAQDPVCLKGFRAPGVKALVNPRPGMMDPALRKQCHGPPQGLVLVGANDSGAVILPPGSPLPQENRALPPQGQNARSPPTHTHSKSPPCASHSCHSASLEEQSLSDLRPNPADSAVLQVSQPGHDGRRAAGMPRRGG